jgi:hypothetical protein
MSFDLLFVVIVLLAVLSAQLSTFTGNKDTADEVEVLRQFNTIPKDTFYSLLHPTSTARGMHVFSKTRNGVVIRF